MKFGELKFSKCIKINSSVLKINIIYIKKKKKTS